MPAAVLNRRTAAAILGLLALGAVSRLPWWQRWVDGGGSSDVTRWNAWQASGPATSALVLAGLALAAGAWMPRGVIARFRYGAALTAWVAVLLLAVQAFRLRSPSDQGGSVVATLTDVQGLPTQEELGLRAGTARPDLHVMVEGAVRADLGFGAYLGGALVLAIAVVLTVRALRRPAAEPGGPGAESAGPAAG